MKKGLVVTICAPSQCGKDYIMQKLVEALKRLNLPGKFAIAYKTRKRRTTDPTYIKSISREEDAPISPKDKYVFSYGDEKVIYDKKEISEALGKGEIVFIATCIPALCKAIKTDFQNNCFGVFVRTERRKEKAMIIEEGKRHGVKFSVWKEQQHDDLQNIVDKRIALYEKMQSEYVEYARDKCGADYLTRNWFTFFGGSWNTKLDHQAQNDFNQLLERIATVYELNTKGKTWNNNELVVSTDEERQKNPLSLEQDFMEYLYEKELENDV